MLVQPISGVSSAHRSTFKSDKKNTYVNYQYYKDQALSEKSENYNKSHKKLKTAMIITLSAVAVIGLGIAGKTGLLGKKVANFLNGGVPQIIK